MTTWVLVLVLVGGTPVDVAEYESWETCELHRQIVSRASRFGGVYECVQRRPA